MSTDTDLDMTVLEHLDFDITCVWKPRTKGFTACGEKATWVLRIVCPCCTGYGRDVNTCEACKELALTKAPTQCTECKSSFSTVDGVVRMERL